MSITAILEILGNTIDLLAARERSKYIDELLEIKDDLFKEQRKPSYEFRMQYPNLDPKDFRNTARIDELVRRMLDISKIAVQAQSSDK